MAQDNGPSLKPSGQRDTLTARALRTMAAEQRAIELEGELCSAREGLAHRDNAISSLEKSLDLNSAESTRLASELAESAAAADRARAQLERTRSALSAAQGERNETIQSGERRRRSSARSSKPPWNVPPARKISSPKLTNILRLGFHNSAAEKRIKSFENSLRGKDREFQGLKGSDADLADEAMKLPHEKKKPADQLSKLSN